MSPSSRETADIEGIEAEAAGRGAAGREAAGWVDRAELESIVTTIAESPIVVEPAPKFALTDWERVRHSPDADEFILAWIASHVRPRPASSLS